MTDDYPYMFQQRIVALLFTFCVFATIVFYFTKDVVARLLLVGCFGAIAMLILRRLYRQWEATQKKSDRR